MASHPHKFAGDGFALRLSILYAAMFLTIGVQMPFLPAWLAAKGMDARTIGFVLAVPTVVRVFALPVTAQTADRRDALRAVIIIGASTAVIGYGALALANGLVAIVMAFAVASIANTPVILLTDAYALRGLGVRGRAYGTVRLWGSAAFIAASLAAGALIDVISPGSLIWLIVAAVVVTAGASWLLAPLGVSAPHSATPPRFVELLRVPGFLTVVTAAGLVQASHAVYYGFSTIAWQGQGQGLDGIAIGALWSLGVLAEIILFAASSRLPAAITPTHLICIGAGGALIRWSAMACDPPAAVLPVLQCLHGLSFGATHLGTLGFVARAAPPGLAATAQGFLAIALGVTMATTTALSGLLYARYGASAYAVMALLAMAGGFCALVAHRTSSR